MEQDHPVTPRRAVLTSRATAWAIGQMRGGERERVGPGPDPTARLHLGDTVAGGAARPRRRCCGRDPLPQGHLPGRRRTDPAPRLHQARRPGRTRAERVHRHGRFTRNKDGRVRVQLLDLAPGRFGEAYTARLRARGDTFRTGVEIARHAGPIPRPPRGATSAISRSRSLGAAPAAPPGLPPAQPHRRPQDRRRDPRLVPFASDPRNRPPSRQRLQRPRQLPPQNAPHRRPTHLTPRSGTKSRFRRRFDAAPALPRCRPTRIPEPLRGLLQGARQPCGDCQINGV